MSNQLKNLLSFSFTLLLVVGGFHHPPLSSAEPPAERHSNPADPAAETRSEPIFVEIAKRVIPSVVNITTTSVVRKGQEHPSPESFSDSNNPFLKRFGEERREAPREQRVLGLGSGVIVDPSGYIITNSHVIAEAKEIRVILNDRREFTGKLVGSDDKSDIAVVKIDAKDLPSASWGNSSGLKVGEYALAIGNSFGLTETVTLGIISAVGRANVGITDYEDFIQTDAPINPGNSGGALVNIRGELIGVNTAIFSQGGGSLGIGFAIPSDMVKPVMESLIKTGRVVRGWLGLSVQEVTPELAKEFGLPKPEGALVTDVLPDSPAEKAGLRRGDVILEANGKGVESTGLLRNRVASSPIGSSVKMTVSREGQRQERVATVQEQPRGVARAETTPERKETTAPLSGVGVRELTPEILKTLQLPEGQQGVVIDQVSPGSSADAAGLQQGDLILEVNRSPARNVREYEAAVSKRKSDQTALLLINRGGRALFLTIRPS